MNLVTLFTSLLVFAMVLEVQSFLCPGTPPTGYCGNTDRSGKVISHKMKKKKQ
jgi:hypothetical protein